MEILPEDIQKWRDEIEGLRPEDILSWAARHFTDKIVFSSSLGLEDQLLCHIIANENLNIPIFTLDTGRLFSETYDLLAQTEERYGIRFQLFFPDSSQVEEMVRQHGINLFRKSVALRKECCRIRKVEPLKRALAGKQAWITGLRREQSVTREAIPKIEWDAAYGLVKISPLNDWTEQQVITAIEQQQIPHNPLHQKGFPTIGCSCCTRAVAPGEDIRSGRWWWEKAEHKECGLHWDEYQSKEDNGIAKECNSILTNSK